MNLAKVSIVVLINSLHYINAISLPEDYNKYEPPSNTTSGELVQVTCKFDKIRIHKVDIEDSSMQLSMKLEFSWIDYRIGSTSVQQVSSLKIIEHKVTTCILFFFSE